MESSRKSEDAPCGGEAGEQSNLRIRIKCCTSDIDEDHSAQEIASPDSDGSGAPGDEEIPSDIKSVNCNLGDVDKQSPPKDEEATADPILNKRRSSSKRKHANKGPEIISTCPECGKTFPSDKALFGHLRCHPERDYRGANPPLKARKKAQLDACGSIAAAPPKAMSPTDARSRAEDDPDNVAARILVELSCDDHKWGSKIAITDKEKTGTDSKQIVRSQNNDIDKLDWIKKEINGVDEDDNGNQMTLSCKKAKKRKMKELELVNDPGTSSLGGRKYHCTICFKTFSSHQALGGHRASHNKISKMNHEDAPITDQENKLGANLKHGDGPHSSNIPVGAKVAIAEHRCTSCNQTFASGQALGGHKRRHFNGLLNQAQSSSTHSSDQSDKEAANSTALLRNGAPSSESEKGGAEDKKPHSSESEKRTSREPLDFDLNKVPEN
ncbi:hypothetical protein Cni_G21104 [Canna indica]|uniref:C2H2-type domain-containing protein n=1 Tax=Canna indica TaxID=4628 RepID=A0AAQ3KSH3_9LILI|nr:hypothetical protein Cni_G21104 [Canna indica]